MKIKHIFPQEFFQEEENVFKISRETKWIWAVLIDLLAEFDRVCRRYGIKYSIDGGTMLGKVRHNGIIPWDDDIDVIITRPEYEKLLEVADREFVHPYFFQTMQSDPEAVRGHPQLRNSSTTAILKRESVNGRAVYKTFNQGIFLDVFVLDAIPDDAHERMIYFSELERLKELMYRVRNARHLHVKWGMSPRSVLNIIRCLKEKIYFACVGMKTGMDPLVFYQNEFDRACRRYEHINTKYVSHLLFVPNPPENMIFEREKIMDTDDVEFMGLRVLMLREWDYYLSHLYGDWKKFVVGASQHGGCIFDVEHPYTDYFLEA